jgi:hypothetical protein
MPREFEKYEENQFDAVKFMREQRNKMSEKLSKMTKAKIIEYLKDGKER